MQHVHIVKQKLAKIRRDHQLEEGELCHLEDMNLAGGSDYVDELTDRIATSRSFYDGSTNEREYARALSYAGFQTSYRY